MNNITLICSGNCLTKPMYCWSFLDVICIIGILFLVVIVVFFIAELMRRKK